MSLDIASVLQTGIQYQRSGRLLEAERSYRQALAMDPRHAEASYLLGALMEERGRVDVAVPLLRAAVAEDPSQSRYLICLGGLLLKQGGLEEAVALFQVATRNYPERGELHEKLGTLLHMKGQAEEAVASYRRALERNPDLVQAHANLGALLYQMGRPIEAVAHSSRAVVLAPRDAGKYCNLGSILVSLGKLPEGIIAFRRALELQPKSREAYAGLAAACLRAGDPAGALRAAREGRLRVGFAGDLLASEYHALHELGEDDAARQLVDFDCLIYEESLPVPPEYGSLAEFNSALAADLRAHPSLLWEPIGKTTRGGRQTANLVEQPTPLSRIFERALRQKLDDFIGTLPAGPLHPVFGRKSLDYWLHIWATILGTGGHQDPHIHAGAWLSGVYYVELPSSLGPTSRDNAGWIEFGRAPRDYALRREPGVKTIQPRAGLVLLFPSYVFHRTIPFGQGGQRISIAFDVNVR